MSDTADKLARFLGYIDYPTDSVEQGDTWHEDANRAPFGPTISKADFELRMRYPLYILRLIDEYSIEFKWLTDACLEVHSVVACKTITTTVGYTEGVLECLTS